MTEQERGLRKEHIWLVALYEMEERAEELLVRLSAIGIDTSEATTLHVEIDDWQRAAKLTSTPLPRAVRDAISGALTGAAVALIAGLALYSAGLLSLPFMSGLFNHAMACVAGGALIGALLGAIFAMRHKIARKPNAKMRRLKSDGFLVAVKMAPRMAEQAEEIARGLGAKEILL